MSKETDYGTDDFYGRNDRNAFGLAASSAYGTEKGPFSSEELKQMKLHERPHLDLNCSNPRLDKYLYYFSSKL